MAKLNADDKKKRKNCSLCADKIETIDYKDAAKLKRFVTEAGKSFLAELQATAQNIKE